MIDSAGPTEERTSVARTGAAPDEPAGSGARRPRRRSPGRRILRGLLYLLYIVVLLEIGSRVYWKLRYNLPFFAGRRDWCTGFYVELNDSDIMDSDLRGDDDHFDVLFLGGSVMDRFHWSIARQREGIQERLRRTTRTEVRTFNLARDAMTTRDSLTKYRLLGEYDKHFDLVIVYHGINDTRMNNCPPAMFRDNYGHTGFYRKFERMEAQAWLLPFFRLPFTVEFCIIDFMSKSGLGSYVPRYDLNPAWTAYGTDIKTEGPFRENLRGILQLARRRGEPVLLVTFAWYVPEGYTLEKFAAGQLDFSEEYKADAVETWGTVEAVTKALKVHNRVIQELAAANEDVLFVDGEALIPKEGANFNDVCHLTSKGNGLLFQAIAQEIERLLRERKQGRVPVSAGPGL